MEELHRIVSNPDPKDGYEVYLKHLFDNNNAKSIFELTGLDLSSMFQGKPDTSGIILSQIRFKRYVAE